MPSNLYNLKQASASSLKHPTSNQVMPDKKNIIHVIQSLGRGGAESMLVAVLKELHEFNNIVVILDAENHFGEELVCDKLICLNAPSLKHLAKAIIRLKKIIKAYQPVLVHSHLPKPNFLVRLAVPRSIPLVSTIHTSIASAADYKHWHMRFLDKFTYRYRKSTIVAVSNVALQDYFSVLGLKQQNAHVLYTFVDDRKFKPSSDPKLSGEGMRLVTVGSYKTGKNIPYLVEVFKLLKDELVSLDVYGRGHGELESLIRDAGVSIFLKGQHKEMQEVLPQYDGFIMPSQFEGFSLSVLEAMAVKLPLLLSDIPSFKEQAGEHALYFDLNDVNDGYHAIVRFLHHRHEANLRRDMAYRLMQENYTLAHHIEGLQRIYRAAIAAG
ncbi:MAG: glycosyltransferase [Chitinophagaceae bacterium]|nr:MAG: glycosyltransferase [Chitinophagaceae bacterium]